MPENQRISTVMGEVKTEYLPHQQQIFLKLPTSATTTLALLPPKKCKIFHRYAFDIDLDDFICFRSDPLSTSTTVVLHCEHSKYSTD
jgi:hypothetical protein